MVRGQLPVCVFIFLRPKRESVRKDNRRVEAKRKLWGKVEARDVLFVEGGECFVVYLTTLFHLLRVIESRGRKRNSILFEEGSQTVPIRPSNKNRMNLKTG